MVQTQNNESERHCEENCWNIDVEQNIVFNLLNYVVNVI